MAERRSVATTTRSKTPKPMSATQRNTLATTKLLTYLPDAEKSLAITAALEAMTEQLTWDAGLRTTLRQRYGELHGLAQAKAEAQAARASKPTPVKGVDLSTFSAFGKLDPYRMREGFGDHQLRAVLMKAPPPLLREAVSVVQARHPGTQPVKLSAKKPMVDYIMERVAPGY